MAESLLGKIARRPRRPDRNAAEDRLTEVFAAVLAHARCSGLAVHLVSGWFERAIECDLADADRLASLRAELMASDWTVRVRTQLVVSIAGRRRRPDLELIFESMERPAIWIGVEVKHGTDPHDRQLWDYVDWFAGARSAVVLLAPRAGYERFDPAELPPSVPRLSWQHTASLLTRFVPTDKIGAFLLDEFREYLREERLMDPSRITPEHLVAFAHHKEAFEALDLVCSVAVAHIADRWAPLSPDQYGSSHANELWWMFPTHRPGEAVLHNREFELDLCRDSSMWFRDGRPGVPVFTVGTSSDPGALRAIDEATKQQLTAAGFTLLPKEHLVSSRYDRIWRRAYPEDLLAGASLQDQGDSLGAWAVAAFEELHRILAATSPG